LGVARATRLDAYRQTRLQAPTRFLCLRRSGASRLDIASTLLCQSSVISRLAQPMRRALRSGSRSKAVRSADAPLSHRLRALGRYVAKDSNTMSTFSHLHTKNASLKGRKRFLADLEDMSHASATGFAVNTLKAAGAHITVLCSMNLKLEMVRSAAGRR
jgi:hypothetical protein